MRSTIQLSLGSFQDYAMPRAEDFPDLVSELTEVPARTNPLGVKGAGEAGAPPAVVGAILDALRPLGIDHIDMPATPNRIWQAATRSGRPKLLRSDASFAFQLPTIFAPTTAPNPISVRQAWSRHSTRSMLSVRPAPPSFCLISTKAGRCCRRCMMMAGFPAARLSDQP